MKSTHPAPGKPTTVESPWMHSPAPLEFADENTHYLRSPFWIKMDFRSQESHSIVTMYVGHPKQTQIWCHVVSAEPGLNA